MIPQWGFVFLWLLIPLVGAGVLVLGRHARRAVVVLSGSAIGLGLLNVLFFVSENFYLGVERAQAPGSHYQDVAFLTMRWVQGLGFGAMIVVTVGAWMLSLLSATRWRAWAWVALIVASACLSNAAANVWDDGSYMRQDPFFAAIFHLPWLVVILGFNALTLIAPLVTLIYGLVMWPDPAFAAPPAIRSPAMFISPVSVAPMPAAMGAAPIPVPAIWGAAAGHATDAAVP